MRSLNMALWPCANKPHRRGVRLLLAAVGFLAVGSQAHADWREELGTFRVGIAMKDGERYEPDRFEGFRQAAAQALGMPVEIVQARDASALIDAQASSRIEYSILSALGYATAYAMCECIEPLAAPVSDDGATGIRSILLAQNAQVSGISEVGGARIAAGPANSVGGDLLPAAGFSWQGKPFARSGLDIVQVETSGEALRMLAAGEVAAAFTWEYARPGSPPAFTDGPQNYVHEITDGEYTVLWRSDPIRFGPHAIRRNLPAEARSALRRMLLSLDRDAPSVYDAVSPALGGGFRPASHDDYRHALRLADFISR